MQMVVKNIKKSKGVSNCVFIDVENVKYILINMNDRIELYDSELKFIKNIEFGKFINNINTCLIDNKEYLIIITIEGEYLIKESKIVFENIMNNGNMVYNGDNVNNGNDNDLNDNMNINKANNGINVNYNTTMNDNNFIKTITTIIKNIQLSSFVIKNVLILFSKDFDIYCFTIKNEKLIFDDFPNDFKYFKILSLTSDGIYLVFLAKDMQGNRIILKYYVENGKLKLKNRISELDFNKKTQSLGNIKNVDVFRNGYLIIGNNFISYEDGDTIQAEFANTFIKSSCNLGNKMLYSMEDGELVQIEILNKKTSKSRSTQENLNLKKILATVIDKTQNGYNFMKSLNKTTILAGNYDILELIRLDNGKIEVINKIICENNLKNGIFYKGMYYLWNHSKIYNVNYSSIPTFKEITKMNEIIQKFVKINNLMILGHYNKGLIMNDTNEIILETEKILNIFKTRKDDDGEKYIGDLDDKNLMDESLVNENISKEIIMDEYMKHNTLINNTSIDNTSIDTHCTVFFNTPNHIYKVNYKNEILSLKLENIILSSYREDKAIFYLNNRKLVLVDLENMKILLEKTVNYQISTLLLSDFILISTFDNKFLCLKEEDLQEIEIIKSQTFIHSLYFKNKSFFSNGKEVYEFNNKYNNFVKIYESYTPITSLCPINSSILIISKESVLINLKNFSKSKIKLQDITHAFYDKNYHFSKGKKLITCDFENGISYNCFLYKNLTIKHSEIVGYFPSKNLIIYTDKLNKSTTILLNDKEVGKIKDFFTNNAIELENEILLSGFTNENQTVIVISKKSLDLNYKNPKDIVLNPKILHKESNEILNVPKILHKESNEILNVPKILHKESNEILNVYNFKEGFIISNSNTLFFYNNRLIKTFELEIDFTIHKIYTNSNYILILDYFRSFVLFRNKEENVFENLGTPLKNFTANSNNLSNLKFDTGVLTDNHIILSSGSILFVYELEGLNMLLQTNLGSDIVYIGTESLDINNPKDIYIFTSNFSIHCLKKLLKN